MAMTPPRKAKDENVELRPDGRERFEGAVDAAIKSGPKHREKPKPKRRKGKRTLALALFALCAVVSPADATMTGNDLKQSCDAAKGSTAWVSCVSYIGGVLDAYRATNAMFGTKYFCEPDGVTGEQLVAMTRQYLATKPKELHYGVSSTMLQMMGKAFPCP
jgi:hypothetical protein